MRTLGTSADWLTPGARVGGYRIERHLASGGMANVFVATQIALGRRVVLKALNETYAHDRSFVERFEREARVTSELNHPNIVVVHELFEERGMRFLVMEHVDGLDLAGLLAHVLQLRAELTLLVLADVARGLQAAHDHGLVHRDIKTENLLLSRSGVVKVTDFGVAASRPLSPHATRLTTPGTVVGTPAFIAPELFDGSPPSPAVDMFGLGVVAHELLTGEMPFDGATIPLLRDAMERPPSLPLDSVPPPQAEMLRGLVLCMLARDPADRIASMALLEESVQEVLRSFDPSGFLLQSRRLILKRLVADPCSISADLSGMGSAPDVRSRRYRELFSRGSTAEMVVAAVASFPDETLSDRPSGPASSSPALRKQINPKPIGSGLRRLLAPAAIAILALGLWAPLTEDQSAQAPVRTPSTDVEASPSVSPSARPTPEPTPRATAPPPQENRRPVVRSTTELPEAPAATGTVVVECGSNGEVKIDERHVDWASARRGIALPAGAEHLVRVTYRDLLMAYSRSVVCTSDESVTVVLPPPEAAEVILACSPPGPATVRFAAVDSVVATPRRIRIGAGPHVIEASRPNATLTGAVVGHSDPSVGPVTPRVISAMDGRVTIDVIANRDQRVILRFAPLSLVDTPTRTSPTAEASR